MPSKRRPPTWAVSTPELKVPKELLDELVSASGRGDELEYNFFGHSIGRWEGDTLVVDTVGLRASTVLFFDVPHGESLRIVERFRFRKPDVLEVSITMTDPVVLTRPWTVTRLFVREPDVELREFVCAENNRHAGDAGGVISRESGQE